MWLFLHVECSIYSFRGFSLALSMYLLFPCNPHFWFNYSSKPKSISQGCCQSSRNKAKQFAFIRAKPRQTSLSPYCQGHSSNVCHQFVDTGRNVPAGFGLSTDLQLGFTWMYHYKDILTMNELLRCFIQIPMSSFVARGELIMALPRLQTPEPQRTGDGAGQGP